MDCFEEIFLKLLSIAAKYLREMNPLGKLLEEKNIDICTNDCI